MLQVSGSHTVSMLQVGGSHVEGMLQVSGSHVEGMLQVIGSHVECMLQVSFFMLNGCCIFVISHNASKFSYAKCILHLSCMVQHATT